MNYLLKVLDQERDRYFEKVETEDWMENWKKHDFYMVLFNYAELHQLDKVSQLKFAMLANEIVFIYPPNIDDLEDLQRKIDHEIAGNSISKQIEREVNHEISSDKQ